MDWINLLLLVVLAAGHVELAVVLVNRAHAFPLGCGMLRQIRHLHDVLVPTLPLALFWFIGMRGPRLLFGGHWGEVPPGWQLYMGLCAVGVVSLAVSSARYLARSRPPQVVSNHSQVVDIAAELGRRPLGDGPFRWLTSFPGNEVFTLEVSTRDVRLPHLPAAWDGLSIVHLSDWHLIGTIDRPYFEKVSEYAANLQPDLFVFTGDLLDRRQLVEWLPTTLGRLSAPLGCFFILGNHDWYLDPDRTRGMLANLGWQNVAGRVVTVEHRGGRIEIGGTERPWMGEHPVFTPPSRTPEASGTDSAFRVLLSHTPDYLGWARSQQVDLMLSGHNHGGQVVLPVIGPVYSPSLSGCRYAGGEFFEEPTLLAVSRGVAGRHPLRLGCRPEVTKLVLRGSGAE